MKKYIAILWVALGVVSLGLVPVNAQAHCEIPCGIYDDAARFDAILEHAQTIEKSMLKINALAHAPKPDYHMITRWTMNKEEHAQKLQDIISVYFLTQRVKTPKIEVENTRYVKHLTLLHQLLVAAMKTKQTTDVSYVETIRELTNRYKKHYFTQHGHSH